MNTANNHQNERNELLRSIERLDMNISLQLHNKYVEPPETPKTAELIVEAIKAGNITMPKLKDEDDDKYYWDPWKGIIWSKDWKPQRDVYKKKVEEFKKELASLKLDVRILEPVEGLKKYRELESKYTD